ncbi:uncharacterized protein LDX57_000841 [Aspergillus melleus]|uniref:uncharacterized protein n=1 Tax=Aspergillus melleus TaxID=138277 RepID=UPI001E8EC0AA|nr:uncharacterized protein LDX57_000841 [Aspergillus melleus]KAH8423085.1 hypothetical protein LDX57_000841 [Aspergillus melleus]
MNDTGAHPGVRNLLARFENSQSNTTSPPDRGRSPVDSENSGSARPLSKVRASFVAVDGSQSPVAGLRKTSGRSDSPAAPLRVRSFNSDDVPSLKSPLSASPTGSGFPMEQNAMENGNESKDAGSQEPSDFPAVVVEEGLKSPVKEAVSSHNKENQPVSEPAAPASLAASPSKTTKTVTKRPSAIQVGKAASTNKPAPKPTPATGPRSSAQPRTPTSPAKTANEKTRTARSPKPPAAATNQALTHKSSRASLNPATTRATTTTRPVRASMPAREATKAGVSDASRTTKPRSRSPAKSTRLSPSATAPSLSSVANKPGTTGTATSRLSRKPSTLKSAKSGTQQRAITPTASSVRKSSRPSPPSGGERPPSRVSNGSSKPVDEGFLARMMRPTASSASKTHEKVDVKSPPRTSKPTRAPVKKVASKAEIRAPRAAKTVEKPQPTPVEKANDALQKKISTESVIKEETTEVVSAEPQAEPPKPVEPTVDSQEKPAEAPVEPSTESTAEEQPAEAPAETPAEPSVVAADPVEPAVEASTEKHVEQPTEPLVEQTTDVAQSAIEENVASPAETTEVSVPVDLEENNSQAESKEAVEPAVPEHTETDKSTSDIVESAHESKDTDEIDIAKLSLT